MTVFNHSAEILWLAAVQCAQIGVLFVVVWCACRWLLADRPYLAHGLWVLVLIKCVTPPVWSSEVGVFSWVLHQPADGVPVGMTIEPMGTVVDDPGLIREMTAGASALSETVPITGAVSDDVANPRRNGEFPGVHGPRVRWPLVVLSIWSAGAVIIFTATLGRFVLYRRAIWESAIAHGEMWDEYLDALRKRLDVWRRVRLVVTRESMGPAVFGLLRPTIVLPEAVVANRSPSELEPILAHELIHVRRGDLWIGLLQLIAGSLWWFYPPAWIAVRRVSRTSEECCDLTVVNALPHARRAYADLLLDVLARGQELRAIPLVPGMKPRDITSRRMELIMTFQSKPSRWAVCLRWVVLVAVAMVTLPGAAWEGERRDKDAAENLVPVEAAKSADPGSIKDHENEVRLTTIYHVPHVYESLMKAGVDWEGAEKLLMNVILHGQRRAYLTMSEWMPPPQFEEVRRTFQTSPFIKIKAMDNNNIVVRAKRETHDRIQHLLRGLAETGVNRFAMMIEHRVVKRSDLDALDLDWRPAGKLGTGFIPENPTIDLPAVPDPSVIQFASIPPDSKDIEELFDQSRRIEPYYGAAREDAPIMKAMFNGQSQWILGAFGTDDVIDPTTHDRHRRVIQMLKGVGLVARLDAEALDASKDKTTFGTITCHLEYHGATPRYNTNDEDLPARSRPRCYVRQEMAHLQFPLKLKQPVLIRGLPPVPPPTTTIDEDHEWIIALWIEHVPTEIWRHAGTDEFRIEPAE